MLRRRRTPARKIDVSTLETRWRRPVEEALEARERFDALVARLPKGPTRDRLDGLRPRLDAGLVACWEIASAAQAAAGALDVVESDRVTARMKEVRRRMTAVPDDSDEAGRLRSELEVLSAQLQSVSRVWDGLDDAAERLRLLELRLDGAVARAAELILSPTSADLLRTVEDDVGSAVDELEALRQAIVAVNG
jgi:hypothetical protein